MRHCAYLVLRLPALLLVLAALPGCPQDGKAACLASNCGGCCDSTGACQAGHSILACGINATACSTCGLGQSCVAGVCTGGDGGVGCAPGNCTGCCDINATCQPGASSTNCGSGGLSCVACGNAQTCNALGVCQNNGTCHGCIDGNGDCQPGNAPGACGPIGGQCTRCLATQTCVGGACMSQGDGGACGPGNCTGCCNGTTTCVTLASESTTQCGRGGSACFGCPAGQSCSLGSCQTLVDGGSCGPANCTGCCNGNSCVAIGSESNTECGTRGAACTACTGTQTCQSGTCTSTASCGPGNCAGCCNGTVCVAVANETNSQCGVSGAACAACTGANTCQAGTCQAAACGPANCATGCCSGSNCVGVASQSNSQCGTNGATCAACTGTSTCTNGVCVTPCGPSNCAGCCNGNSCVAVANQSNSQCGTNGAACAACTGSNVCQSGVCTGAGCGPGTCAGCCNGTTCVALANESDQVCGSAGIACSNCTSSGEYCGLGQSNCVVPGPGSIGAPCTTDGNCHLGYNSNEPWCVGWPSGYCDDICDSAQIVYTKSCGSINYCLGIFGSLGGNDFLGLCLLGCFTSADCKSAADFCDFGVGDGLGYCVPTCSSSDQCKAWFNAPSASCNPATGQCCGVVNFACCAGVSTGTACNDGSTCQANGQCK